MLFNGIAGVVWHTVAGPWASSGEGGTRTLLQAHVDGFVLCRLVRVRVDPAKWDRQGGCERHAKAGSLLPWQTEPGGTLQAALEGDNHERDNGLFRVNRS